MDLIVDLHIHSHYSRATSPSCNIQELYRWGKIKGINIIGTGDFTHPAWLAELQEKLEPAEPGLFTLKKEFADPIENELPESVRNNLMRFILTVEISTIYSKGGKVRKLHNLIVVPSFESAMKLNARLDRIGNLKADGRPILGLDSKELLRIVLEVDERNLFIPAHIWTPWFAMFGSKSGFNSIKEAFEDLSPHIYAIETGLSSDPFMNWRLKELQNVTIISNSDAHSPQKLGREATVIRLINNSSSVSTRSESRLKPGGSGQVSRSQTSTSRRTNIVENPLGLLSYDYLIDAIKTNDERIVGTIEFFPQEGKYHYDGHRVCKFVCTPEETKKYKGICPKCSRPLTVGVDYRVSEISDYAEDYRPEAHKQVEYIIPLTEILAELNGVKSATKKVWAQYEELYAKLGNEFDILRNISPEKIQNEGFPHLAFAIKRMRAGKVHVTPGYDGVYGIIKVFGENEDYETAGAQLGLGI